MEHVIDYYSRMQDGLPTVLKKPIPPRPKPPVPDFPRHGVSHRLNFLWVLLIIVLAFSDNAFKEKGE